jgi:hypothetical protein
MRFSRGIFPNIFLCVLLNGKWTEFFVLQLLLLLFLLSLLLNCGRISTNFNCEILFYHHYFNGKYALFQFVCFFPEKSFSLLSFFTPKCEMRMELQGNKNLGLTTVCNKSLKKKCIVLPAFGLESYVWKPVPKPRNHCAISNLLRCIAQYPTAWSSLNLTSLTLPSHMSLQYYTLSFFVLFSQQFCVLKQSLTFVW